MDRPLLHARKHIERPHVLVVSDDSGLASFLVEGLPLGGFWTSHIASGLQALEVFRLRQFDIVAIDAGLQSFDSIELVRRLRGQSIRASGAAPRTIAPIVLISDRPVTLNDLEQKALGIERILQAPLELHELVAALHAVFDDFRERYPSVRMSDDPSRENF